MNECAANHEGPPRIHDSAGPDALRPGYSTVPAASVRGPAFRARAADQFAEITARIVQGPRIGASDGHSNTTVSPRRVLRPTTNGIFAIISTS